MANTYPSVVTALLRSWSIFKQLPPKTRWQLLILYIIATASLLAFTHGFYALIGHFVKQSVL